MCPDPATLALAPAPTLTLALTLTPFLTTDPDRARNNLEPILLHTNNPDQRKKKGTWLASTMERHCGASKEGWLSCINVAWLWLVGNGKGGAVRKATFGCASPCTTHPPSLACVAHAVTWHRSAASPPRLERR